MPRIVRKRLHPVAQHRLMHTQILRGLPIGHAAILDQPNSLKLELACKLPPLHLPPPVPSKHLTQCLQNRVQAKYKMFDAIKDDAHKHSFAYRLLYSLRNYAQHHDSPISWIPVEAKGLADRENAEIQVTLSL